jgi:hypothetical protein
MIGAIQSAFRSIPKPFLSPVFEWCCALATKGGSILRSFKAIALILALMAMALFAPPVAEGAKLSLTASTSKPSYGAGETITISGMLRDEGGNPVGGAAISIQINSEAGRPVGLELVYTNGEGKFSYEFKMPAGSDAGSYRIFLTASKPGFEDASAQLGFAFIPEAPMGSLPILMLALISSAILLLRRIAARGSSIGRASWPALASYAPHGPIEKRREVVDGRTAPDGLHPLP